MTTAPGTVLDDRWQLLRRLGDGGTASVWSATDLLTGAHVAVKVLHAQLRLHEKNRARFEREAAALQQLDHPHIAKLLHHSLGQHAPFLVLELLQGSTLADLIGSHAIERSAIPPARVTGIFEQVASAVSFAHERGILHRDIKPSNVMVDPTKVLDFGLAKLGEVPSDQATTRGRVVGSYFYMSPEQTQGEPAEVASDVFGLGCILYEMLTLKRAWAKDKNGAPLTAFAEELAGNRYNVPTEVMERIRSDPRPLPSAIDPELAPFDAVIERALAIDPYDRFRTVADMVEELTAVSGVDTTVTVEGPLPQTAVVEREPIGRSFWWMAGGMILVSAIVSMLLWPAPAPPEPVVIEPHVQPEVRPSISVTPKETAIAAPSAIEPERTVELAPKKKRVRRTDPLLERLDADPNNLELLAAIGREIELRAKSIPDQSKRERIERIAVSSVMAGDATGLRQALLELAEVK